MIRLRLSAGIRNFHQKISKLVLYRFGNKAHQAYIRICHITKTTARQLGLVAVITPETPIDIPPSDDKWAAPSIPEWVRNEMRDLAHEIDPALYPSETFISSCVYYVFPIESIPGEIYNQLMRSCTSDHYTHVFAIPWMKRGGADLVSLMHIEYAASLKNAKVLVIMTEPGDSPWKERIPKNVDVIDTSVHVGNEISNDHLLLVLVRMLVQLRVDMLHIINSRHFWEIVSRYGLAISQRTRIFASIYCDDYNEYGQPVGYGRQFLPSCYRYLARVFTDNTVYPELLHHTYGYDRNLFHVLKSPVNHINDSVPKRDPIKNSVLWAGRIDRQKRPDLLLSVAKAMPDVTFTVYGEAVLNQLDAVIEALEHLPNIQMKGAFNGVESLPFQESQVFLYTSQWDGTPTMVIGAALSSIPIVASQVGGVGDIVDESRGYPVVNIECIQDYVTQIRRALSNSLEAEERGLAARNYVLSEHSKIAFETSLASTSGYNPTQ